MSVILDHSTESSLPRLGNKAGGGGGGKDNPLEGKEQLQKALIYLKMLFYATTGLRTVIIYLLNLGIPIKIPS